MAKLAQTINGKKQVSTDITDRFFVAMDQILSHRVNGKKFSASKFGTEMATTSTNLERIRKNPGKYFVSVEAIGRICNDYGISAAWLITGQGDPFVKNEHAADQKGLQKQMEALQKSFTQLQKEVMAISKTLKQ